MDNESMQQTGVMPCALQTVSLSSLHRGVALFLSFACRDRRARDKARPKRCLVCCAEFLDAVRGVRQGARFVAGPVPADGALPGGPQRGLHHPGRAAHPELGAPSHLSASPSCLLHP